MKVLAAVGAAGLLGFAACAGTNVCAHDSDCEQGGQCVDNVCSASPGGAHANNSSSSSNVTRGATPTLDQVAAGTTAVAPSEGDAQITGVVGSYAVPATTVASGFVGNFGFNGTDNTSLTVVGNGDTQPLAILYFSGPVSELTAAASQDRFTGRHCLNSANGTLHYDAEAPPSNVQVTPNTDGTRDVSWTQTSGGGTSTARMRIK